MGVSIRSLIYLTKATQGSQCCCFFLAIGIIKSSYGAFLVNLWEAEELIRIEEG